MKHKTFMNLISRHLNLRNKCPSIVDDYSHESDEWDFDSSSSSNSSDQNSDNSVVSEGEAK